MLQPLAAIAAGLMFFVAQVIYLQSLRRLINAPKNPLRPRIVSWIIWLVFDTLTFVGMIRDPHTKMWDLGQFAGALLGGYMLSIAIWKHLERVPPKKFEYGCGVLAAISLVCMLTMREQYAVIAFAQLGAVIGTWPTIASVRENPYNEPLVPWLMYLGTAPLQYLAVEQWSLATIIPFVTFVVMQIIIVYYVGWRRLFPNSPTPPTLTIAELCDLDEEDGD